MNDDDDSTPQVRPIEPETSAAARSPDPAVYLRQKLTQEENTLSEVIGLPPSTHVPWWMFSKVAVRLYDHDQWIVSRAKIERRIRRSARLALGTLAANILVIGGFLLARHDTAVRLEERAAAADQRQLEQNQAREREIRELRDEVRELRAVMLRKLGDIRPTSSDVSIARTP